MATPGIHKLTLADYERIPPDGNRHEFLGGEEFVTPAPDVGHQRSSGKLQFLLAQHVKEGSLGEVFAAPTDVVLSDEDIVQPDLIFISTDRSAIVGEKNIQGAPDLVIEILSPSTAHVDRTLKRDLYARAGVREYWIVDRAARLVEVHVFGPTLHHRVHDDRGAIRSDVLPALTLRVADIL